MKYSNAILVTGVLVLVLSASCNNDQRSVSHPGIDEASVTKGKSLAAKYCQGCHALPNPSLLDAKTWQFGVLPNMGPRLGIFDFGTQHYRSNKNDLNLSKSFYPSQPLLKPEEWGNIIDYYTATAPDTLPSQQRPAKIQSGLSLFKPQFPSLKYDDPTTCFIQIDTTSKNHSILMENVVKKNIYRLDSKLKVIDSFLCGGTIVDIDFTTNKTVACNIGVLNPNNGKFGNALIFSREKNGKTAVDPKPLFDSLARPVQITSADFNNDGLTDYVVCEFGHMVGDLSWMENLGNGKYQRHVLRPYPGAIKAYVNDYNKDGLPDLWVLFSQGEEGIFLFTNQGHGKFSQEQVLRFPPVYGSSYFELADFNSDGYPDIVYTCGDNADFSPILKPYHGVYIFLNDGKNHFTQKYFFPIHGCYKSIVRDFDGDGDLDMAVISFFADYAHQPEEGFVYLENKGNFEFQPFSLKETQVGRWLSMDAADLDGDGRIDIVLGNFSVAPGSTNEKNDWKKGPPFLFLKNVGKQNRK